jgi:hypothetical protein
MGNILATKEQPPCLNELAAVRLFVRDNCPSHIGPNYDPETMIVGIGAWERKENSNTDSHFWMMRIVETGLPDISASHSKRKELAPFTNAIIVTGGSAILRFSI